MKSLLHINYGSKDQWYIHRENDLNNSNKKLIEIMAHLSINCNEIIKKKIAAIIHILSRVRKLCE